MYLASLYSGKVSETADSLFETGMAIDLHVFEKALWWHTSSCRKPSLTNNIVLIFHPLERSRDRQCIKTVDCFEFTPTPEPMMCMTVTVYKFL
jgi:hypothetical protein